MLFGYFVMKRDEEGRTERKDSKLAWISGEGFVPGTFPYLCRPEEK